MAWGKAVLASIAIIVGAGCASNTTGSDSETGIDAAPPTTSSAGPRSQVIEQLSLPPGADLLKGDSEYEMWVLTQAPAAAVAFVQPQLPIDSELHGFPWCKSVTKPDSTRWLWGSPDDGISVAVTDDQTGANPGGSRVAVMTGMDGGALATNCVG